MPAKACQWFYNDFTLFSALPVLFNMYTDKDSNLINDWFGYKLPMNELLIQLLVLIPINQLLIQIVNWILINHFN